MNFIPLFLATLLTPWSVQVDSTPVPLNQYPRPQFQRNEWINLNGAWDYTIDAAANESLPTAYEGKIRVPFAVESYLSGVKRAVGPNQQIWYRRTFDKPDLSGGKKLILHFGAVDWQAKVYVNGEALRLHQGGYDAFSIDITNTLKEDLKQELVVSAWNPVDEGSQPRGKQQLKPSGIMYTAVTGIWQTVWLEILPPVNISELTPVADFDKQNISITLSVQAPAGVASTTHVQVSERGALVAEVDFKSEGRGTTNLELALPKMHTWSPKDPFLYDVKATLLSGQTKDIVTTYFGVRKIEVRKASDGFERIYLNNNPLFLIGPLDQGWWPDGLYTAPTDEALRWDVETMRKLGFNVVRKHVKVEPARWYYHCDKIGLLVLQDFPSGFRAGKPSERISKDDVSEGIFFQKQDAQFRRELLTMISQHAFFPSIISWVPFNEGWGQHDTNAIINWVKRLDPTRLVDGPSGWNDLGLGDLYDKHQYPGPGTPIAQPGRASILGEFGGLGLPLTGHLWQEKKNWGYRNMTSQDDLTEHYATLINQIPSLVKLGLNAAIYTQITDVETEVNGLITYDRKVIKVPVDKVSALNHSLTDSE
jgi:beta-galactosidase/beta-glucuronidase